MAAFFIDLFGETLLTNADGSTVKTKDALEGKEAVGLYFSAHWCPPCRRFTPILAEKYKKALSEKGLEVVFVSGDKNEKQFTEYFGDSMPWLSLPWDSPARESLSKKFSVKGIPCLVVLNPQGEVITKNGTACINDNHIDKFPHWEKIEGGGGESMFSFRTILWLGLLLYIIYSKFFAAPQGPSSVGN